MQSTGRLNEGAETEKCIDSEPKHPVETKSVRGKEHNSALHEPCVPSETKTTSSMKIRGSPEGIETHREYLFNSALGRLRNREQAEDVVQETFLAAFTSLRSFMGESSKRTWLTAILNHKVCDHLRHASRDRALFENLPLEHWPFRRTNSMGFGIPGQLSESRIRYSRSNRTCSYAPKGVASGYFNRTGR